MAYEGIFSRDYVGDTPDGKAGTSWTNSPDIYVSGTNPLPDPSILVDKSNYDKGLPDRGNQSPLITNFVYARGINTLNAVQKSTMYLYYVDTSIVLWPQNWKMDSIFHDDVPGIPQNAAQLTADPLAIVASLVPYRWTPPRTNNHYCLVTWTKNGADQLTPPDLYKIGSVNDMGKFILSHPEVAWKNTTEVDATVPDIENYASISGAEYGGVLNVGVQCLNLPTDGYIEFYVPGPDKENTVIFPKTKIPTPNYAPTVQVKWPGAYNSAITFRYYKGDTPLPDGANIIPIVGTYNMFDTQDESHELIRQASIIAPNRLADVEFYASPADVFKKRAGGIPPVKIFIVGSVPFDLRTK